jgi:hypothetical protein
MAVEMLLVQAPAYLGMVDCDTCLRLCHPGGRLHAEPIVIKHCLATLGCHACIKPDMVNGSWGLTTFSLSNLARSCTGYWKYVCQAYAAASPKCIASRQLNALLSKLHH